MLTFLKVHFFSTSLRRKINEKFVGPKRFRYEEVLLYIYTYIYVLSEMCYILNVRTRGSNRRGRMHRESKLKQNSVFVVSMSTESTQNRAVFINMDMFFFFLAGYKRKRVWTKQRYIHFYTLDLHQSYLNHIA